MCTGLMCANKLDKISIALAEAVVARGKLHCSAETGMIDCSVSTIVVNIRLIYRKSCATDANSFCFYKVSHGPSRTKIQG